MEKNFSSKIFQHAAKRAGQRPFFVASDLATYRELHKISEKELAMFLSCSQQVLPKLALCRRPNTAASSFREEVERIASYAGVNTIQLAKLFREVESFGALRSASSNSNISPSSGVLMAARDRTEENVPKDQSRTQAKQNQELESDEP